MRSIEYANVIIRLVEVTGQNSLHNSYGCRKKSLKGFTLLELIVVVAITAIMVTIGVPSFLDNIRSNRLTTQANAFVGALNLARAEALKRGVRVTLCRSSNNTSCDTAIANNRQWETGWLMFAETVTVNGQRDTGTPDEPILRMEETLANEVTLRSSDNFAQYVQYLPSGRARGSGTTGGGAAGNDTFLLCDPRGTSKAKSIAISASGRPAISNGASTCP